MSEKESQSTYPVQIVRGFPCPVSERFTRKNIEDTMDYVPGDGDVIVASYPKTGTTWMNYIILQIRSKGEEFPSFDDVTEKVMPYFEIAGLEAVLTQDPPRYYKHHIAYDKVQKNAKSKCIYTYRHPEDTVVSFYHFTKNFLASGKMNFNQFFDSFLTGNISYGSYFQHILSFYKHREDENLLMVSYEKLQANTKDEILRIARFLGEEHYSNLLEDEQVLNKVMEHTSFDYMKKNLTLTHPDESKKPTAGGKRQVIEFFRKGIVGDGKTVLTETQRRRLREAAEKILEGTSILTEWYSNRNQFQ